MNKHSFRTEPIAFVLAAAISLAAFAQEPVGKQPNVPVEPIFGTWKLDPSRSSLKRGGPAATNRPIRPATWVFSADGDGFRMNEYDGTNTNAKPTHWEISPYLLIREARVNGKPTEWVVWAISSDANVLTSTSWDPDKPEYHNVRVFDRQK
jgi:hypothetical protein